MDKNRIDGLAKEASGSIKEAIGKLTGNATTEAEGKAQAAVGKGADAVKNASKA